LAPPNRLVPGVVPTQFQQLRRVLLVAERAALRDAYERGAFSSEVLDRLRATLDADEISIDSVDGDDAER